MKIDNRGPQTGKTTKIIEWVKAGRIEGKKDSSNRIIVVLNLDRKEYFMKIHELGFHEIETFTTIQKHYYGPTLRKKELWFDDVDEIICKLFPMTNIKGISLGGLNAIT